MSIEIKDGAFTGNFGGQLLNGLATPSIPGSSPVPGLYHIAPPLEDIVFGLVAVMTPVGVGGGVGQDLKSLGGKFFDKDSPVGGKFWQNDLRAGGASAAYECIGGRSASLFDKLVPQGNSAASYVLSSRPIPGRNCLVIHSRLADLMEALKYSGGADVRVY